MLIRTDPFRDLDWLLTQQVLGTAARPATMPMDAYREKDTFYVHFDLPAVRAESITLTVEHNMLTVRAERFPVKADSSEMLSPSGPPARSAARSSSARPLTPSTSPPTTPPAC